MNGDTELLDERKSIPAPIPLESDFRSSEGIGKLVEALANAQLEFKPIKKSVENAFYTTEKKKSMYADLAAIIAATQAPLARNRLVVMQWPVIDHERKMAGCTSRLAHTSGEWTECTILLPATEKRKIYDKSGAFEWKEQFTAQTCGIAITYSRRYSYQSVVGVAAEEDDDANAISINEQGSTEAAKAIAATKTKGKADSLFYRYYPESQTYQIGGSRAIIDANQELLRPLWDETAGCLVADAAELGKLISQCEKMKIPLRDADAK